MVVGSVGGEFAGGDEGERVFSVQVCEGACEFLAESDGSGVDVEGDDCGLVHAVFGGVLEEGELYFDAVFIHVAVIVVDDVGCVVEDVFA